MRIPPRASRSARLVGGLQAWALAHGVMALRIALGVSYFWFGALKFNPLVEEEGAYLPGRIVSGMSMRLLDGGEGTLLLAYWECWIGFCLVAGLWLRTASILMLAHMLIMLLPAVFMPRHIWESFPFLLTIKGQFVLDNLVFIACGLMLATSVPRGPPRRILGRPGLWMRAWDDSLTQWLGRHGILLLRLCLGLLYVWYGALKFVPGASALESLIQTTVQAVGEASPTTVRATLAVLGGWECLIGVCLALGRAPRVLMLLILAHLLLSCLPVWLTPDSFWLDYPFQPTLIGKFTARHLTLGATALVVAASVAQKASGWSAGINPFLRSHGDRAAPRPQER